MTDNGSPITMREFRDSEGVDDWRVLSDGACAFYPTATFADSSEFVTAIAAAMDDTGHMPEVDIRAGGVTVRLISVGDGHYGLTRRDLDLARKISAVARERGLTADPSALQSLLVIPAAPNIAEIMPFWRAVLGYEPRPDSPDEDIVDPHDRGPAFWLEQMQEPRPDSGGAIHIAVWVPYEQAEARVAAAIAAGGRLVRDNFAPAWWTLADPAGNEADIATTMHRD